MLDAVLGTIVAAGLAVIFYHHVLYPLLLTRLATRVRARPHPATAAPEPIGEPSIAIIIPAYNEEAWIEAKIRNLASIDYNNWHAIVALDGCSDATADQALDAAAALPPDVDLQIVEYPRNIGKIAVLNDRIALADADIIALTDTSALLPADALRRAAAHFRDPVVGFAAAAYRLGEAGSEGELAYIRQLRSVRRNEAALHSPLGAHGALYFFRRSLFRPLPPDTINDDFVLPLQIVEQGYRGVYDDEIEAIELETTRPEQEFRRRVRIGAGNLQQSIRLAGLASPRRPWLAFMFVSGKGLRPLIPLVAILVASSSLVLAARGWTLHAWLLGFGILTLAAGVSAILLRGRPLPRLLAWLGYLIEGHFASFLGAWKFAFDRRIGGWQRDVGGDGGVSANVIWKTSHRSSSSGLSRQNRNVPAPVSDFGAT